MIFVLPLSKLLADQVMKINKGSLAAKDERMKMVDEMFGSVSFPASPLSTFLSSSLLFLVLMLVISLDQIHQVLCMGGTMDRENHQAEDGRDEVASEGYVSSLSPFPL